MSVVQLIVSIPVPPRLIDLHFILLKRLSLAKNSQRERFDSIITRVNRCSTHDSPHSLSLSYQFASRFDLDDGEHLTSTGYLQADITIKIRILKVAAPWVDDIRRSIFVVELTRESIRSESNIQEYSDRQISQRHQTCTVGP